LSYENHATLGIVRGGTACGGVLALATRRFQRQWPRHR